MTVAMTGLKTLIIDSNAVDDKGRDIIEFLRFWELERGNLNRREVQNSLSRLQTGPEG